MLFFSLARTHVDDHFVLTCALAHDHALVHLLLRVHEEATAELQLVQRVAGGDTEAVGHHGAAAAVGHVAGPRHPAHVVLVQQRGAASGGHQQRAEADQATARALEGDDRAAGVARAQVGDTALAGASSWVTVPTCSSGTSHTPRSCGSNFLPLTSLVMTWGG
jgi:hypothetical protein